MTGLSLAHGLTFENLHDRAGLERLDGHFLDFLRGRDGDLADRLTSARRDPAAMSRLDQSELMLALAPPLQDFLAGLFGIGDPVAELTRDAEAFKLIAECKRNFVQRRALKAHRATPLDTLDGDALAKALEVHLGEPISNESFARAVAEWEADEETHGEALSVAERYAAWATLTDAGRARHPDRVLFGAPDKVDFDQLVPVKREDWNGVETLLRGPEIHKLCRDGFHLTDMGAGRDGGLDQAHYCVICHNRGKDSCSIGLKDKKTDEFQKNPLGVQLTGCPLEERISEMHQAFIDGHTLGGLAIICVDNPMVAGTGHRICNDCMKACIYQKQTPVNIPQAETRLLKDVLGLPWGFEIYSLLTRWNPMNFDRPLPKPDSGYKVLVVGLGPAGYTLAHHLVNDGHAVVAMEGLKLEPLEPELSGVGESGARVPFQPIRDVAGLFEDLDSRVMAGFGGVAEYGITVRWDKNFLKLIRLLLERRDRFAMFGGVRFGGTITAEDAFAMGFDHVALCVGAGKPTTLDIPNGLAKGVRQASDFLMGLQLTGAAKTDSVTNLQLRLPVVVIGGGLTGIDTATEALFYYARQVEKFAARYEALEAAGQAEALRARWNPEETTIANEFLDHGRQIIAEKKKAAAEGREPDLVPLLDAWGGSVLAYRRRMVDSPAYRLNHEEIEKALEQGIRIAELVSPAAVEVNPHGHAKALKLERMALVDGRPKGSGEFVTIPARSILVAAGTQPNTTLSREHPGLAELDGKYYKLYDRNGEAHAPEWSKKPKDLQILTSHADGGRISFFGDLHPAFAGNVVSAMASARAGYPLLSKILADRKPSQVAAADLFATLNAGLRAKVVEVKRLTPTIVEVIVHAPQAAKNFRPGQFFRLMNHDAHALKRKDSHLLMEGLALTGAWVDVDKGLVSVIVLEMGGSSNLCAHLKPGEPVILMGPTGAPTETPAGETVMLVGGGLGNAVLFSIGQALRAAGSRVLYFGGYKKVEDRYHVDNILKAGDVIVWACDEDPGFTPNRTQDKAIVANIVQAIQAYGQGDLGEPEIPLDSVDRIIAIGSDRMMKAVAAARHGVLKPLLNDDHEAIGSINSPMQCMMKEICAQCLQRHVDPKTGEETVVYSCFNQDQGLDRVDFGCLNDRLAQNSTVEKMTAHWIAHCLEGDQGI